MRRSLRRLLPTVLALVLAGCAAPRPPASTSGINQSGTAGPGQCRIGPDGGPMLGDRGIGGTGSPLADRGIGGTGAPSTGIVGVITGFASVCLAGEEVQYAADTPVEIDKTPARLADLRAGQVAAISAAGAAPWALRVSVRHEVSGPAEGTGPDGLLRVAGQPVLPLPDVPAPPAGTWLSVSGFRRGDGVIVATRLDPRPPGDALLRGVLVAAGGRLWIGTTEIRPGADQFRRPGVPVVAIGRLRDGMLAADTVEPDALLLDPNAYFGTPGTLIVQGYAEDGFVQFGGRRYDAPFRPGLATLRLERGGDRFNPVSVRPFGPGLEAAPRAAFGPAPVPNRGLGRPGGFGAGFGGGRAFGRGPQGRQPGRDDTRNAEPAETPVRPGFGLGGGEFGRPGGFGGFGGGRGR